MEDSRHVASELRLHVSRVLLALGGRPHVLDLLLRGRGILAAAVRGVRVHTVRGGAWGILSRMDRGAVVWRPTVMGRVCGRAHVLGTATPGGPWAGAGVTGGGTVLALTARGVGVVGTVGGGVHRVMGFRIVRRVWVLSSTVC